MKNKYLSFFGNNGKNRKSIYKVVMVICGTLSVILGILGMLLPLLPTTPFLLLAAYCYAKSSKYLHNALLNNRWFGPYIKNYCDGKGITIKHKIYTIVFLWLSIGYTAIFVVSLIWLKLLLFAIAVGVTAHIISIDTYKIDKEKIDDKLHLNET
ncbi:MAG: YbaN family protein [Candidatus Cloacimonetes bacterium]|nr:YbaN family protein [Candidatus Cloacimonadota bacterium]MBS3768385.1 YbaN family protein [Candidatus Cloacimonadota bacterium]